jgi:O-antigen/teichoic acid export membrane protein
LINKSLYSNKIAKKTFLLYSAVILNIFLGWAITKLNTHYLTVEEFGQYSFFVAVIYFLLSFFTFGIFDSNSRLQALQKNEDEKRQYFSATMIMSAVLSIAFVIFVYLFSSFSDSIFEVKIAYLLEQNFFLVGIILFQSFLLLSLRGAGQIKILSLLSFSPRMIYLILLGYIIYANDFTLTNSIYFLFAGLLIPIIIILIINKPTLKNLKQKIAKIYDETKRYGIHLYFSNILSETLSHADKLLISYFLQAESMAYYGLAYMLTFPLSHFSKSLATTLFSKFANEEFINSKILKTNLLFISITVFVFILFREYIIVCLFSNKYMPAVELMLPLALAFGFSGLSKPFTHFLMAKGYGEIVRNISIVVPVFNILLNLILIPKYGINGAAWVAFFAYGLDLCLYWYYYNKKIKTI